MDIPHAPVSARPIIEGLCEDLRIDRRTRGSYIDRAEEIGRELDLASHCQGLKAPSVRKVTLMTSHDDSTDLKEVAARIDELKQSLFALDALRSEGE